MRFLFICVLAFCSLVVWAGDNPYATHYQAQAKGGLVSMQPEPATELLSGTRKQEDNVSMLEQGYDLMGISSFETGEVPPEQALAYGKEIKADKVLVYVGKARKGSPLGQMEFIREARKAGKELTEQDLQALPQYRYYASYWAKLPAPLLGVHVIKLGPKDADIVPAEGVNVIAVIQGSPAAQAGLQRGDILLSLAGRPVNRPEELSALVAELQAQAVELQVTRGGEARTLQAHIGKR